MIIEKLAQELKEYDFVKLTSDKIKDVYELMKSNQYFYDRLQFHPLQYEECLKDLEALPPNTKMHQKYYYGIYENGKLIAVIDLIESFPDKETAYIGLFMLHQDKHGLGIGKKIIEALKRNTYLVGFKKMELGCYKENEIGYHFWHKMGFKVIKSSNRDVEGHILTLYNMQLLLNKGDLFHGRF